MSELRIVTKKEFLDFIFAQDDDRKLDFDGHSSSHACGCPMIHFGRERLNLNDCEVGASLWRSHRTTVAKFESEFGFSLFYGDNITTYGELKTFLGER